MANIIIFQSHLFHLSAAELWHILHQLQTKFSNNAQLHYYAGSAPFHKAEIMLYNPKTKQTIIRGSLTQLESSDPIIPSLPLSISEIKS